MQARPLSKDGIMAQVKGFKPTWPDIVSINFKEQTVTVVDIDDQEHVLPMDQVELYEEVNHNEPL